MNQQNRMKTCSLILYLSALLQIAVREHPMSQTIIGGITNRDDVLLEITSKFYASRDHGKAGRKELFFFNLSEHPYILKSIGNYC